MNYELAKQEAVVITERIRANGQIAVNAVCAIGKDLRKMKAEKLYEHIGYESFENYAESEFNLKRRQAYQYISVYENLGEEFVQSNAQLGITKLALLTQIDASDRREIMEEHDLETLTVNEVKELLDKVKIQGEQLSMFEAENAELKNRLDVMIPEEELKELKIKASKTDVLSRRLEDMNENCTRIAGQRDKAENKIKKLEVELEELRSRPIEVAVSEPEIKEVEVIKEVPDKKAIAEKDQEISTLKAKIAELEKASENKQNDSEDKKSFKALYTDAYKSFSGLVEFVKSADAHDKEIFTDKTKQLVSVVIKALED